LLIAWREGDRKAARELFALLYQELRRLARAQLRRQRNQDSLATTGLVHEAYVKLADQSRLDLRDRGHFLSLAARAMRQIVVDHARRRGSLKRGGAAMGAVLDEAKVAGEAKGADILALDEALARLETLDERISRIVEMRFFGGLSVEETAGALGVSERTVKRDWQKARAFLKPIRRGDSFRIALTLKPLQDPKAWMDLLPTKDDNVFSGGWAAKIFAAHQALQAWQETYQRDDLVLKVSIDAKSTFTATLPASE
jgi:RNA polymerase sigma factor (TIGR02999 family)